MEASLISPELVSTVRSFNRTVTLRVGALDEEFLARELPLGQARVLWEVGVAGCDVRRLRSRLDLDSGYLSRMLRSLEAAGLIEVRQSPADGRVRTAYLTEAGLAERAELDRRSDEAASSLLAPLSARQQARLTEAMAEVERLLTASAIEVVVADPAGPDARYCIGAYFAELAVRFEAGFEAALTMPVDAEHHSLPGGLFLVARLHGEPVGCGALTFRSGGTADLKRMWVAPEVRGLGLGRRLLDELEARAAAHGARIARLETNRSLTEAIGMYRSAGYREVEPFNDEHYAHHWFAKDLRPDS